MKEAQKAQQKLLGQQQTQQQTQVGAGQDKATNCYENRRLCDTRVG